MEKIICFRTVTVDIYQLGNKGLESLDNRFRTASVDIYQIIVKTNAWQWGFRTASVDIYLNIF